MRLERWHRIGLAIIGGALLAASATGAAKNWSGVALTSFTVAGVIVLVGSVVGVFPRGSINEGTVDWPEVDVHQRIEALETQVAQLIRSDAWNVRVRGFLPVDTR